MIFSGFAKRVSKSFYLKSGTADNQVKMKQPPQSRCWFAYVMNTVFTTAFNLEFGKLIIANFSIVTCQTTVVK